MSILSEYYHIFLSVAIAIAIHSSHHLQVVTAAPLY